MGRRWTGIVQLRGRPIATITLISSHVAIFTKKLVANSAKHKKVSLLFTSSAAALLVLERAITYTFG